MARAGEAELRRVIIDAVFVKSGTRIRQEEAQSVINALGIRETCWKCGHDESYRNHDRQTADSLRESHRYMPVLCLHLPRNDEATTNADVGPDT